jgi:PadR family transcriptional regulator, regulatory protein PadR
MPPVWHRRNVSRLAESVRAQPFGDSRRLYVLLTHRNVVSFIWEANMTQFEKNVVWQGTLSLMVLRTLLTMGEQHGYGIARRIEQTSQGKLSINYGTLYPALLKLEQEGLITSAWGVSENNRKAKFYKLTRAGRKQIERDTRQWEATSAIMTRFLATNED